MGSVRELYTTGDNDPEIEPVRYYRHYLYCDACGSFDLQPWQTPQDEARERTRRTLAMVAIFFALSVAVSGWQALGLVPPLSVLVYLAAGLTLALILRRYVRTARWGPDPRRPAGWRFFGRAVALLLAVAAVEWLATELLSPLLGLLVGVIGVAGALIWRWLLDPKIERFGMRCAQCDATYPYGTPFFTDLDANPRGLVLGDVPRPLGVSPFERGAYVGPAPGMG
jgi:hypothetical protein